MFFAGYREFRERITKGERFKVLSMGLVSFTLAGILIPLALVLRKNVSRMQVLMAGALAIFGVLMEKTWILAAGQAQPWLNLPNGIYAPTWVEIVGVVGMVALGFLLYLVALRLGPQEA